MGELWVARHDSLARDVALKFLSRRGTAAAEQGPAAIERFRFEARTMAQLSSRSRHIVTIFDHGEEDGVPFLVMELVEGESLETRMTREARVPLEVMAALVSQIARGLSCAHAEGLIHRDLKPANVLLSSDEDQRLLVKILDFGLAKAAPGKPTREGNPTGIGIAVGSPHYMSPEQARGLPDVDSRCDLGARDHGLPWSHGRAAVRRRDTIRRADERLLFGSTPHPDVPQGSAGPLRCALRASLRAEHRRSLRDGVRAGDGVSRRGPWRWGGRCGHPQRCEAGSRGRRTRCTHRRTDGGGGRACGLPSFIARATRRMQSAARREGAGGARGRAVRGHRAHESRCPCGGTSGGVPALRPPPLFRVALRPFARRTVERVRVGARRVLAEEGPGSHSERASSSDGRTAERSAASVHHPTRLDHAAQGGRGGTRAHRREASCAAWLATA